MVGKESSVVDPQINDTNPDPVFAISEGKVLG